MVWAGLPSEQQFSSMHSVLPESCTQLFGLASCHKGQLVVAYEAQGGAPAGRLGRVTMLEEGSGQPSWCVQLAPRHGTRLFCGAADGRVIVADAQQKALRCLDTLTGKECQRLPLVCSADETSGLIPDTDGSVLLRTSAATRHIALRRFAGSDGREIALWSSGIGAGLLDFAAPQAQPLLLPTGTQVCVGWDGRLYLLDATSQHLLAYDRAGRLSFAHHLQAVDPAPVSQLGVDRQGVLYLLHVDEQRWCIARRAPGSVCERWAEDLRSSARPLHLAVGPAGTLHIGSGLDDLRTIAPDGQLLWQHFAS